MLSRNPSFKPRPAWARYSVAVGCVVLSWITRETISPLVGPTGFLFIFFFPATALAAWFGRFGPGLLAAVLSALAADWFFMVPVHSMTIWNVHDAEELAAFLFSCAIIIGTIEGMHRAERSNARFVHMIDSAFDAIIVCDVEDRIIGWNRGAEELYGWTRNEAAGRMTHLLFQTKFPMPYNKILEDELCRDDRWEGELIHTRKDGQSVTVFSRWTLERWPNGSPAAIYKTNMDITERKRAEEALRVANEKLSSRSVQLEALVQERTAKLQEMVNELQHISYAMVHDMRAPLRAMNAFVELMCEAPITPEQTQNYGRRIRAAAGRLDHLVQDALRYTKIAHQDMTFGPVDLSTLLRGLIETYPNLHGEKAEISVEEPLPVVIGDEGMLTQCFSNLLGNAVKFVAPGVKARVIVQTEMREGMARIWIRDNGIGIPRHSHRRLFKMFQRLNDQYEGTGIGLAIVHKVVERMGGNAGVESDSDQGSDFWVELPVASAALPMEMDVVKI
ncbi:MAG: ATP-binding protein [Limisphaerales bacterium]